MNLPQSAIAQITAAYGAAPVQDASGKWTVNGLRIGNTPNGITVDNPGSAGEGSGGTHTNLSTGNPNEPNGSFAAMIPGAIASFAAPFAAASLFGGGAAGGASAGAGGGAGGGLGGGTVGGSLVPGGASAAGTAAGATVGGAASGSPFGGFLTKMGSGLTALGAGAASGRAAEATANQNQYGEALKGVSAQLQRAALAQELQQQDYSNELRGGALQGVTDFNVTPPPNIAARMGTVTGGLRPSAITGAAGIGQNMQNSAALDLLGKGNPNSGFTGVTGTQMPTLPGLPSPNAFTSALPYAGAGLNFAGLIQNYLKNQQPPAMGGG